MKKLPPTNAELRYGWAPLKTWLALTIIGAILTLARNLLYDIPFVPLRRGLTPLIVLFVFGGAYATAAVIWLRVRRLFVGEEGRRRF